MRFNAFRRLFVKSFTMLIKVYPMTENRKVGYCRGLALLGSRYLKTGHRITL